MFIFSELQCSRRGWINTSRSSLGASLVNFCLERENKRARESTLKDRDRGQCSRAPHYNPSPLTPTSTSLLGRNFQSISEETHHKNHSNNKNKNNQVSPHLHSYVQRVHDLPDKQRENINSQQNCNGRIQLPRLQILRRNNKTIIVSQWYTVAKYQDSNEKLLYCEGGINSVTTLTDSISVNDSSDSKTSNHYLLFKSF